MNAEAIEYLKRVDPVMAGLIEQVGPVHIEPSRVSPVQSLIHAIAHQQLTGRAANTILKRFQELFGNGRFPTPEQILEMEVSRLCGVGFSKAKAGFVRAVAERSLGGFIPTVAECVTMTDAEIIAQLIEIKGVGRWTVEMFLIFNLGRPDVLPIHDFGVRRGFQMAYRKRKLPEPTRLEKFGKKWSPHRTTAALYLYRAADLLKDGKW